MSKSIIWKINMLFKAISLLKNWYMYPAVYFHLTKKPKVIFETKNGEKITIRTIENSTDIHIFTEIWLERLYSIPNFEISSNDQIIDVGAHIGIFSIFASQLCKNGKVFSYEPAKPNFEILQENISQNNINNIIAENKAGSNLKGKMKFYFSDDDFAAHSLYDKGDNWDEVETLSLKDIFDENNIKKCDFLKMDCEGAEYDMLMNLPEEYFRKISKICLEYHTINDSEFDIKDLEKKLTDEKFNVTIEPMSEKIGFLYALNQTK